MARRKKVKIVDARTCAREAESENRAGRGGAILFLVMSFSLGAGGPVLFAIVPNFPPMVWYGMLVMPFWGFVSFLFALWGFWVYYGKGAFFAVLAAGIGFTAWFWYRFLMYMSVHHIS